MSRIRFNQRSQKVYEVVQPRPTLAEKVRRLRPALSGALSNLLTSSNLAAHTHARTRVYIRAHARACVYIPVRYVRRLDRGNGSSTSSRLTLFEVVRRTRGGWT